MKQGSVAVGNSKNFHFRVLFKETLSMFAEAINSPAHLESFSLLAKTAGLSANETFTEIEENIRWVMTKAPEIALWVENEKGTAMKMKFSVMAFVTFVFVMFL